jgi:erythromycin esterase
MSSKAYNNSSADEAFRIEQSARVISNGESYFHIVRKNDAAAWNIREQHIATTIKRLFQLYGKDTKIILWGHNTHVGDARFTTMPQRGKTNPGEILRKEYGDKEVFIVGFGSYAGKVVAGNYWGDSARVMKLPEGIPGSWEYLLHKQSTQTRYMLSSEMAGSPITNQYIRHRSVGIIYTPLTAPTSNYVHTVLSKRYDAFIYIDVTGPLHPVFYR